MPVGTFSSFSCFVVLDTRLYGQRKSSCFLCSEALAIGVSGLLIQLQLPVKAC